MSFSKTLLPSGARRAIDTRLTDCRKRILPSICAEGANLGCCPDSGQIIRPASTRHHLELRSWHRHRLSRASPTCTALATSPITAAASSSLPGLLLGSGLFLLGFAACIFVVAAVPAILATRQTMLEMQTVLRTVERELPDTAAAVRLSGLELSDAIEEVSLLSNDLTAGVRATAQMMTSTRNTLMDSVLLANAVMASHVLPAVRSHIPGARSQVEDRLRERAELKYTAATVQQMASTFKGAAKRTRAALAALDLAGALRQSVQTAQQLRSPPGPHVPLAPQ